jgi:hypothetical protein
MADHLRTKLVAGALANAVAPRPRCRSDLPFGQGLPGGFKRSSQHLESGGADGQASRMDDGADGAVADEVAGCASASAGGRARVLA